MKLLKPLTKDIGHFKGGFYGDTGSGKSTTAALIAIGLYLYRKMSGPIAFYDSERGSGFLNDLFTYAKIPLVGIHSRAFDDLTGFMTEAEKSEIGIAIIDSVTHPWRELITKYKAEVKRQRLRVDDWGPLKERWQRGYSMPFVNAKMSILMCGRKQNIFEDVSEDDKTWKPVKVGTRMAVEGEVGYEPNVLMELERRYMQEGGSYARVGTVLKDRSFRLDGQEVTFTMPMDKDGKPDIARLVDENLPFAFMLPHVESLDPDSDKTVVTGESKTELFDPEGNTEWMREQKEKELLLGNIESLLHKYYPSRDKLSMKAKNDIIEGVTWALGRRTRNWDVVSQKFKHDLVRMMYYILEKLFLPEKRERLNDALVSGVGEKGEIINADASPEAIMRLCETIQKESGTGPADDLPF